VLVGGHGWELAAVVVDDPAQEHAEEHAEPDEARDDGEPLRCASQYWRRLEEELGACVWEGGRFYPV
jgi:hypothetical protein